MGFEDFSSPDLLYEYLVYEIMEKTWDSLNVQPGEELIYEQF